VGPCRRRGDHGEADAQALGREEEAVARAQEVADVERRVPHALATEGRDPRAVGENDRVQRLVRDDRVGVRA
jgi:urease alpha subunit